LSVLSIINSEGTLKIFPEFIFARQAIKRDNVAVPQILIKWTNLPQKDASWEDYDSIKQRFPNAILEDKNAVEEEVMSEPRVLTIANEEKHKKGTGRGR
jgi:Chromo (CHRromatin Organisation MOdifier) domain